MLKNLILAVVSIILIFFLAEIILNFTMIKRSESHKPFEKDFFASYTSTELDEKLGLFNINMGMNVINQTDAAQWNPYFGCQRIKLNKDAAKKLFSSASKKVVFIGGSLMMGSMAPNYMTKIDYYIHNEIPGLISINLSEIGMRSTNEMIRVLLEVVN